MRKRRRKKEEENGASFFTKRETLASVRIVIKVENKRKF